MKVPYNRLHTIGDILFAARGGQLHTFSLTDGSFISSWQHPSVEAVKEADNKALEAQTATESAPVEDAPASSPPDQNEPPAKRQRVDENSNSQPAQSKKKAGKHHRGNDSRFGGVPDRPVISQLASTADGRHVVAITGHDKAVWTFEHNGQGHLTQLSKRVMPKRASSLIISHDSRIIIADKFGDVYALPLLIIDTDTVTSSNTPVATKASFTKPSGNSFTVHSKGNLQALANQQRQIELQKEGKDLHSKRADEPDFELSLLLGHVSMLTSVAIAEKDSHKYLITSDRDEHIRVSRYIPQTHIIQSYCLGHSHFIGDVTIPDTKKDILVSGGGDDDLFVWDWENGKLLSKVGILAAAKSLFPDLTNIAVTDLYSLQFPSESGPLTFILAICEGVAGIFAWRLQDDNTLTAPSIIQLPGNPLHLTICPTADDAAPIIAVALHLPEGTEGKSLHIFKLTKTDDRLATDTDNSVHDDSIEAAETDLSDTEIRNLYYNIGNLRKTTGNAEEAGQEEQQAEPQKE